MTGAVYIPSVVLKRPPGLMRAESQMIGSPSGIGTLNWLMVAKNKVSTACNKKVSLIIWKGSHGMNKSCVKQNIWLRHNVHLKWRHDVKNCHLVLISIKLQRLVPEYYVPSEVILSTLKRDSKNSGLLWRIKDKNLAESEWSNSLQHSTVVRMFLGSNPKQMLVDTWSRKT